LQVLLLIYLLFAAAGIITTSTGWAADQLLLADDVDYSTLDGFRLLLSQ